MAGADSGSSGSQRGERRPTGEAPGAGTWPAGTVIAQRYVIERLIASGGMSRVYLAMQRPLDRAVALKCLVPLDMDPGFRQRFLLEASVCARLEHPCIVTVHDYGEAEDGALFMATEYLRGDSLATLVSTGGPFTPARVVRVAGGIARALRTAHRAGIVHRDLKPGNVMLVPDDEVDGQERVKLLDFGLVKLFDVVGASDAPQLTMEGMMLGSPRFMAPEQIIGAPVDPRTDVYALGTVLYLLLDGRPPFTASSPAEVLKMHIDTPPPPFSRAVPPLLSELVFRCLEKVPDARFASIDAVIEALDRVRDEASASPPATYRSRALSFMEPDDATTAETRSGPHAQVEVAAAAFSEPSDTLVRATALLPREATALDPPPVDATEATPRAPAGDGWASLFDDASRAAAAQAPVRDGATPEAAHAVLGAPDDAPQTDVRPTVGGTSAPDVTLASPISPTPAVQVDDLHTPEPRPLAMPLALRSTPSPPAPRTVIAPAPNSTPRASMRAPPSRGRRWLWAGAALIVLGGALAAAWQPLDPPTLRLRSEPEGALVLLDAQPIGFTPLVHVLSADARGRTLKLEFALEGHAPYALSVLADRPLLEVAAALTPRVAEHPPMRPEVDPADAASVPGPMLTVISRPAGARVALDGTEVGVTPYVSMLPPGTIICHVRVTRDEQSWEADIVPNEAGHFAAVADLAEP